MLVWDSVVDADPLVSMVISPHTVIEHIPSFLNEFGQKSAGPLVFRVDAHMAHQQDDFLAHDCALNGCASVVQQMPLVLLYRHLAAVLEDLCRCCVFKTKGALHHLVRVGHFCWREAVLITE